MNHHSPSVKKLRQQLRQLRQTLPHKTQQQHALLAQQHLHNFLNHYLTLHPKTSLNIAFFLAQDGELPTYSTIQLLWTTPHQLFLPILPQDKHNTMCFAPYSPTTPLQHNKFALPEPKLPSKYWLNANKLDLVLTPLVGFDSTGNRLGMGGGYYDQTFQFKQQSSKIEPLLIGWAHQCQYVEQLPAQPWDIPLDMVITEQGIQFFSTSLKHVAMS